MKLVVYCSLCPALCVRCIVARRNTVSGVWRVLQCLYKHLLVLGGAKRLLQHAGPGDDMVLSLIRRQLHGLRVRLVHAGCFSAPTP